MALVALVLLVGLLGAARAFDSLVDRAALAEFFEATGGSEWTDRTNWLAANASMCTWFGVTCSGDGSRVTSLCVAMRGGGGGSA